MIVSEDDSGAPVDDRVADNRAKREIGAGIIAGMPRQVETAGMVVQMRDPQAFPAGIGIRDAPGEEGARGRKAIELQWKFGALIMHGSETYRSERKGAKESESA